MSVVIPTLNRPHLLEGAVRSALAQTYEPLDVWIGDDGSVPPAGLPSDLLQDPRVHLRRVEPSRGSGGARNDVIAECEGELLAFLDDDDEWYPAKLERQVRALLAAGDGFAGAECGYEMWDGRRLVFRYLPLEGHPIWPQILWNPGMAPSTVLIRRSAFEEVGRFDASLPYHHDWDLWIRLALAGHRFVDVQEVLALRRDHAPLPPDLEIEHRRPIWSRVAPHIVALSSRERALAMSRHVRMTAACLARLGEGPRARALLWRTWRENPRALILLPHLARSVVGERAWGSTVAAARAVRRAIRRLRGRDPLLVRW